MGFRWRMGVLIVAACLAGCQTRGDVRPLTSEIEPPPRLPEPPASCSATEAAFAAGRFITAPLLEELRLRTGSRRARTQVQGEPATTDFDTTRLNVDVEPSGRIVGARCG